MGRAIAIIGAIALVAIVVVGVWLYLSLDYIVKRAIEHYGSEIIGASVELDKARLSPADGTGSLTGLRIGNPKGFRTPQSATVGDIQIAVAPGTIVKDVVLVHRIVVASPSITYEPGNKGSNFDVIQRNVERYLGSAGAGARPGKKLIVETLTIRGARVAYAPQVGHGSAAISFSLPDIQLRNVGKDRGGVTAGELAKTIVDALVVRMAEAMGRAAIQRGLGVLGR